MVELDFSFQIEAKELIFCDCDDTYLMREKIFSLFVLDYNEA